MNRNWSSAMPVFTIGLMLLASACAMQIQPDLASTNRTLDPTTASASAATTVNSIDGLPDTGAMTIAEVIKSVNHFSRLATAVETAGMDLAFAADGPLTVFAPDNAAFDAVPEATRTALLADPVRLAEVLQYHIVVDQADSETLARLDTVQTAAGEPLTVTISAEGGLLVDGAQIVYTDLPAANGVIHVINQILTPPTIDLALPAAAPEAMAFKNAVPDDTLEELKQADTSQATVVEVIHSISGLKTAATAIDAAGMTEALQGRGPFTLFVPTDPAFQEIPAEQIQALLNDRVALADRLRYHLVLGDINSADLATLPTVLTASGEELVITVQADGQIFVNGAPVYQTDIEAANGVIHVIGGVLTPPSATPATGVAG